jgi:hypothetical protein
VTEQIPPEQIPDQDDLDARVIDAQRRRWIRAFKQWQVPAGVQLSPGGERSDRNFNPHEVFPNGRNRGA